MVSVRRGFFFLLRKIVQVYAAIKGDNFHVLSLDSLSFIMSLVYISELMGLASLAVQADLRLILSEIDSELIVSRIEGSNNSNVPVKDILAPGRSAVSATASSVFQLIEF